MITSHRSMAGAYSAQSRSPSVSLATVVTRSSPPDPGRFALAKSGPAVDDLASGVGSSLRTAVGRSSPPWRFGLEPFQSLACGVGRLSEDEDSLSFVRGSDTSSGESLPSSIIPEVGKVSENSTHRSH